MGLEYEQGKNYCVGNMFTRIKVSRLFINSTPARLSHLELVLSMLAVVLSMDGGPFLTLLGEETRKVLGLG